MSIQRLNVNQLLTISMFQKKKEACINFEKALRQGHTVTTPYDATLEKIWHVYLYVCVHTITSDGVAWREIG